MYVPATLPATKSHSSVNSLPTQISSLPPIPMTQFYHDPVLFEWISYLEANMEQLNGQVKMVQLELQNEKQKNNQHDSRARKWWKLNVEAWVLTSAEGKQLACRVGSKGVMNRVHFFLPHSLFLMDSTRLASCYTSFPMHLFFSHEASPRSLISDFFMPHVILSLTWPCIVPFLSLDFPSGI